MTPRSSLGEHVKNYRRLKGWTQEQLAEASGVVVLDEALSNYRGYCLVRHGCPSWFECMATTNTDETAVEPCDRRRPSPAPAGPQGMYKGGFAGKAMFTYRYGYRPAVWERLLTRAGFVNASANVVEAPQEGHIGTLIVKARTD